MILFLIFFILSLIVAGLHIYRDRKPRTGRRAAEILLLWLLVVNTGFGGLYAFSGHLFAADEVAASIGWPAGNPFQTEVAVANLAIGTLGILCYWIRGNFWTAAVIATSIWLLGAAAIHVREIVATGNYNPGNAGLIFYLDIISPLLLITLLVYLKRVGRYGGEVPVSRQGLTLSELVLNAAEELRTVKSTEPPPNGAVMEFQECEMELHVVVNAEANVGAKFWVVEAGGKASREAGHTITLKFEAIPGEERRIQAEAIRKRRSSGPPKRQEGLDRAPRKEDQGA